MTAGSNTCHSCSHWRRAEALVPLNYGACSAIQPHIVDFTGVPATIRRIGKPGQSLEPEQVEFITDRNFSCSSFAPQPKD